MRKDIPFVGDAADTSWFVNSELKPKGIEYNIRQTHEDTYRITYGDNYDYMDWKECCYEITKQKAKGLMNYAITYAWAGMKLDTDEEILAHIPYLQSNISHWRGDKAKQVKVQLKRIMSETKELIAEEMNLIGGW